MNNKQTTNLSLVRIIILDVWRHPLRILLFLAVLGSAVAVVLSTHHNRQLLIEKEKLMAERDALDVEWRNLVLEQSALTEHNRIAAKVQKQLGMYRPASDEEVVVRVK